MNKKIVFCILFSLLCAVNCFATNKVANISGFTSDDRKINQQLEGLFNEWEKYLTGKLYSENQRYFANELIWDGIFPKYSTQKVKVLFIGREPIGVAGRNYIEVLHEAYNDGNLINSSFHRRMLKISYGLIHNSEWNEIPNTNQMDLFNEISFAIMDYSKISNESGDWKTDAGRVKAFIQPTSLASKNYWAEEIQIINPDIIIAMNLEDPIVDSGAYSRLGNISLIYQDNKRNIKAYKLTLPNGKVKLLISTYHFSAIKKEKEYFYEPIKMLYEKYRWQINK